MCAYNEDIGAVAEGSRGGVPGTNTRLPRSREMWLATCMRSIPIAMRRVASMIPLRIPRMMRAVVGVGNDRERCRGERELEKRERTRETGNKKILKKIN